MESFFQIRKRLAGKTPFKPPPYRCYIEKISLADLKSCELVFFDIQSSGFEIIFGNIIQLSAKTTENSFSRYISPRVESTRASKTLDSGLTLSLGKILDENEEEIESVDLSTALKDFITFCESFEKKVILVAYNANSFDMRYLLRGLEAVEMVERFSDTCVGYIEMLAAARKFHPKNINTGPANHELQTLVKFCLGKEHEQKFDAEQNATVLNKIFNHMGKREDYHVFSYEFEGFVHHQVTLQNAKDLDRELDLNLKPKQMMQLAKNFGPEQLQWLAEHGEQKFKEEVSAKCKLLTVQEISGIFAEFEDQEEQEPIVRRPRLD